ncbi:hypothetical protein PENSPDRAFT_650559 [Peniophora sp. CONT]|nr:hypothetical protein PENSPDRAFT_650559 [Peniophora sp. CONT]
MSSSTETRKRSTRTGDRNPKADAFTESAKRQVAQVGEVAQDAVLGGVWIYPILGIFYILSHPSLIRPLLPALSKGILIALATVVVFFTFTYLPQVAVLVFVSGPLAFIAAVPLVLGEAYVVINFLTKSLVLGQAGVDLFDAVLVQKGHTALVERGRQVTSSGGKGRQLGKLLTKPLSKFSTDNMVRYLLSLPLNFIPVVGTVFFLGYNGLKSGPGYHARYFQLKGYDKERRQAAIHKRRGSYTAFGTMAMALNLVPVVSILFSFTTSVGAALWAADLESKAGGPPSIGDVRFGGGEETEVTIPTAEKGAKEEL